MAAFWAQNAPQILLFVPTGDRSGSYWSQMLGQPGSVLDLGQRDGQTTAADIARLRAGQGRLTPVPLRALRFGDQTLLPVPLELPGID